MQKNYNIKFVVVIFVVEAKRNLLPGQVIVDREEKVIVRPGVNY